MLHLSAIFLFTVLTKKFIKIKFKIIDEKKISPEQINSNKENINEDVNFKTGLIQNLKLWAFYPAGKTALRNHLN